MIDTHLNKLILNNTHEVSTEAFFVYILLRADCLKNLSAGTLKSSLTLVCISNRIKTTIITVDRVIQELLRAKWIKYEDDNYLLGDYNGSEINWYAEPKEEYIEEKTSVFDVMSKLLEKVEAKKKVNRKFSPEVKEKFSFLASPDGSPVITLEQTYRKLYKEKFGKEPVDISGIGSKANMKRVFLKRYYETLDQNLNNAIELMEYVFIAWDDIKKDLKLRGSITYNIFGTIKLVNSLLAHKEKTDKVSSVTHRFDPTKAEKYDFL